MSGYFANAVAPAVCTALVGLATAVAVYAWWKRRQAATSSETKVCSAPDISVPEALHTLVHGPRDRAALAARALTDILCGEVQVLEEVLDEAKGKHLEYGRRRSDGRSIFAVALHALLQEDELAEAFIDFLLQCTYFDKEWDETDEWNELALETVAYLRDTEAADAKLEEVLTVQQDGLVRVKSIALRKRLAGERLDAPPLSEDIVGPGMLSMNTRVCCPVCLTMAPEMVRCQHCNNVSYFTQAHLEEDAARHGFWCDFQGSRSS